MRRLSALLVVSIALAGCKGASIGIFGGGGDGGRPGGGVDSGPPPVNGCGDHDPSCTVVTFGPPAAPFPLRGDPMGDPNEGDNGVVRDKDGYLGLGMTNAAFNFLWISNTDDWGRGTVSKIDSRAVREVARYFSVTCYSNPTGSKAGCDGNGNGCCVRDDFNRYTARTMGMPPPAPGSVQLNSNSPSRTAVDWNGDVWVANRAFGGQASVSKIANDPSECTERNGTPGIQTSSDVDGNGVIDTDCNGNGVPDDIDDVKATPCTNGKPQEFYGLDDECVLFTTNTSQQPDDKGRPLTLGPGAVDFGPSDAWAGMFETGRFFRIDGNDGSIKVIAQAMNTANPPGPLWHAAYGATTDQNGIIWIAIIGDGRFGYFDSANPQMGSQVRGANGFGVNGYGISLDRDQNVWEGGYPTGNAYRYTPDRTNGFARLGQGTWTVVNNLCGTSQERGRGRGIAADSRAQSNYFVWMACDGVQPDGSITGGWAAQINSTSLPTVQGMNDMQVDGTNFPNMKVAGGNTIGVGVDVDQNIWGISNSGSVATRIKVDAAGNMSTPDITSGTDNAGCPVGAGDRCSLGYNGHGGQDPYTYSDFTGFGLRNFTNPRGAYSYVFKGCDSGDTHWLRVEWTAKVPLNTSLSVRSRSGNTPAPDMTWGTWSTPSTMSPEDLTMLVPMNGKYLQVEFDFATMDKTSTAKLQSFTVYRECGNIPG